MSVAARRTRRRYQAPVNISTDFGRDRTRREDQRFRDCTPEYVGQTPPFYGGGVRYIHARGMDVRQGLRQPITRSETCRREGAFTWRGVEKRSAKAILLATLLLMLVLLGIQWSGRLAAAGRVAEVRDSIDSARAEIKRLENKRDAAALSCNVSYQAAQQGMVPKTSIPSIALTLPPAGRSYREAMNALATPAQENPAGTDPATLAMLAQ